MKLKLRLSNSRKKEITEELLRLGVSIDEESDLILTEENYNAGELFCKDDTDHIIVAISDIIYIESMGKNVSVHTQAKVYRTTLRLHELERILPEEIFLRISNSVIIKRNAIKRVRPAIGQKFYLTLSNNAKVDVTRTYYYKFKDYFGI